MPAYILLENVPLILDLCVGHSFTVLSMRTILDAKATFMPNNNTHHSARTQHIIETLDAPIILSTSIHTRTIADVPNYPTIEISEDLVCQLR